jgi:hypothetical protein
MLQLLTLHLCPANKYLRLWNGGMMMSKLCSAVALVLCGVTAVAFGSVPAFASPVGFGGSTYDFINSGLINWTDAEAQAESITFSGTAGHLATVTSDAENTFLLGLIDPAFTVFTGAWLGGNNTGWLVGPESGATYAGSGYSNFGGIEPNNLSSNVYMNLGPTFAGIAQGQWADAGGGLASSPGDPVIGYFVEWDVAAVPLPAGALLLGSGLGLLAILSGRRRRAPITA